MCIVFVWCSSSLYSNSATGHIINTESDVTAGLVGFALVSFVAPRDNIDSAGCELKVIEVEAKYRLQDIGSHLLHLARRHLSKDDPQREVLYKSFSDQSSLERTTMFGEFVTDISKAWARKNGFQAVNGGGATNDDGDRKKSYVSSTFAWSWRTPEEAKKNRQRRESCEAYQLDEFRDEAPCYCCSKCCEWYPAEPDYRCTRYGQMLMMKWMSVEAPTSPSYYPELQEMTVC